MPTHRITMTSKGQLTLPVSIRRQLGLRTHDQLTAVVVEDGILLKPDELTLETVLGSLPSPEAIKTGDFQELVDEAAEEETVRLVEEFAYLNRNDLH